MRRVSSPLLPALSLGLFTLFALAGCGTKGPLYREPEPAAERSGAARDDSAGDRAAAGHGPAGRPT
jgi:predicted small lipoprotein YifL